MSRSPRIAGAVGIHGYSGVHLAQLRAARAAGAVDGLWAVAHRPELDPVYVAQLTADGIGLVTRGWPRGDAYYQRNGWAGQLVADGVVINDSPANNACAHHLNIALFLAGSLLRIR